MRTIAIAAAAAVVILTGAATGAAWAGLPTTPNRSGPPAPATTNAPATSELATNPLIGGDVSRIEGIPVYGEDGKLGYVSTALIDPLTKKIDRLVVTAGGVLGIGGHRVALPVGQFTWDGKAGVLRLAKTMASLKSMPQWVEGDTAGSGSTQPPRTEKPSTGAGDSEHRSR